MWKGSDSNHSNTRFNFYTHSLTVIWDRAISLRCQIAVIATSQLGHVRGRHICSCLVCSFMACDDQVWMEAHEVSCYERDGYTLHCRCISRVGLSSHLDLVWWTCCSTSSSRLLNRLSIMSLCMRLFCMEGQKRDNDIYIYIYRYIHTRWEVRNRHLASRQGWPKLLTRTWRSWIKDLEKRCACWSTRN